MWEFEKLRICGIPFLLFQMKYCGGLLYKLYEEVWAMNALSRSDLLQQTKGWEAGKDPAMCHPCGGEHRFD